MLSDRELGQLIGRILKKRFSASGLQRFEIESGEDHDGDPAIFIVAHLSKSEPDRDAISMIDSAGDIRAGLRMRGDPRLPYVRLDVSDLATKAAS